MTNNKLAFSLAEVLMTLLIIGIVAAFCYPTLQVQIQTLEFKSGYKKAFSSVNQAWKQGLGENTIEQRFGGWCDTTTNNANFAAVKAYFKIMKDCGTGNAVSSGCWASGGDNFNTAPNATVNSFIDDSGVSWAGGENICGAIILDVNGLSQPNLFGRDRFALMMGSETTQIQLDRVNPWPDKVAAEANECSRGECYYTSWLYE